MTKLIDNVVICLSVAIQVLKEISLSNLQKITVTTLLSIIFLAMPCLSAAGADKTAADKAATDKTTANKAASNKASSDKASTDKAADQISALNDEIQNAYKQKQITNAIAPYKKLIQIYRQKYGAKSESVAEALRNYAYLCSSCNLNQDAKTAVEEASKIFMANASSITIGNSRLGKYAISCPSCYETRCMGGRDDDDSWVSTYEFYDKPKKSGQQFTFQVEIFENIDKGHFKHSTIQGFLNGAYAKEEIVEPPKDVTINGIKFSRAVACAITPGYYDDSHKNSNVIYFGSVMDKRILIRCQSPAHGAFVTMALVTPALLTLRQTEGPIRH